MTQLSTQNLSKLPDVDNLKKLLQSLATLDLIMSPEWEDRYYSFNSKWDKSEEMGSMRNGCGDSFFALFNPKGCFLKGFAHEYPMSSWKTEKQQPWQGVLENVPSQISGAIVEPAFSMEDVSFCFWCLYSENSWNHGPVNFLEGNDPDGSEFLLECLNGKPETYQVFVEEYYEEEVPLEAIKHVYKHLPLTQEIVNMLNPQVSLTEIKNELDEIGYFNAK